MSIPFNVGDICARTCPVIDAAATCRSAARHLHEVLADELVVLEGETAVGMVSARDLVRALIVDGRDADTTRIGELVAHPLAACRAEDSLFEAIYTLRNRAVRRLPVVDANGRPRGLLAMDDLVAALATHLRLLARPFATDAASQQRPAGECDVDPP